MTNDSDEIALAVRAAAPFEGLSDDVIAAITAASSLRRFASGEHIFSIGQFDGSEFLIVKAGRVQACSPDQNSGAMIFEEIRATETFGLSVGVAAGDSGRFASMTLSAESDCEVIFIDSEAFRDVLAQRPSLTRNLMLHFARTLSGGIGATSSDASPERRIFAALVGLVVRDAVTQEWRIPRMPKHRELAESARADESAAANAVATLIQTGVARRDYPGLVIDDLSRLNKLAS